MFSTIRVKAACFILLVILVLLLVYVSAFNRKSHIKVHRLHGGNYRGGNSPPTHELLPAGKGPHGHLAALDPIGKGISTITRGHNHEVLNFKDTGMGSKGLTHHIHDITDYVVPVTE